MTYCVWRSTPGVQHADTCAPTPQEEADRQHLLHELQSLIRPLYKDAKLTLFGSSCSGFGFRESDVDVCLTFGKSKDGKDFCHAKVIKALKYKLRRYNFLEKIFAITTAKVPIVHFLHAPSGLEVDISLYNTLAQHNTRLLKTYSLIDTRIQELGYALKHLAKTNKISDASQGSLSSYAYLLMAIHYLQQCKPPVVPVLQELYPEGEPKPEVMVDNWNVWFFEDIGRLKEVWTEFGQNNWSVGELWLGMLRFYLEQFDFKKDVVCIRQKAPLTRLQKEWTSSFIAVEDPFRLDRNVGKSLNQKKRDAIKRAFAKEHWERSKDLFGMAAGEPPSAYSADEAYCRDEDLLHEEVFGYDSDEAFDYFFVPCSETPQERASINNECKDSFSAPPGRARGTSHSNFPTRQRQPRRQRQSQTARAERNQQPRGFLPDNQRYLRPHQNQQQQLAELHQPKEPQQQPKRSQKKQKACPEGHHPHSTPRALPVTGTAAQGFSQGPHDTMGAVGAKPVHCLAPPIATPSNFLAPPMSQFPAANGQAPPHPDVQYLQSWMTHYYGQQPENLPPSRHAARRPPNLPRGQQEPQPHHNGFRRQRPLDQKPPRYGPPPKPAFLPTSFAS